MTKQNDSILIDIPTSSKKHIPQMLCIDLFQRRPYNVKTYLGVKLLICEQASNIIRTLSQIKRNHLNEHLNLKCNQSDRKYDNKSWTVWSFCCWYFSPVVLQFLRSEENLYSFVFKKTFRRKQSNNKKSLEHDLI